jgi:hypothetical protein
MLARGHHIIHAIQKRKKVSKMFDFVPDETVEVGKRGRKAIEIDPDIRKGWDNAIAVADWDKYYSADVTREAAPPNRSAEIMAGIAKRDLEKLRKETLDKNGMPVYRLSVVTKNVSKDKVRVSFRVYPVSLSE